MQLQLLLAELLHQVRLSSTRTISPLLMTPTRSAISSPLRCNAGEDDVTPAACSVRTTSHIPWQFDATPRSLVEKQNLRLVHMPCDHHPAFMPPDSVTILASFLSHSDSLSAPFQYARDFGVYRTGPAEADGRPHRFEASVVQFWAPGRSANARPIILVDVMAVDGDAALAELRCRR